MEYWNTGILEGWFLKGYYPFSILSSTQILPLTPNCIIPEPIIPLFHYSSIPIGAKPLTRAFLNMIPYSVKSILKVTPTNMQFTP